MEPPGLCSACVAPARLCLACASAADSCWVLTPSERAAAANIGDDVSARPAANSGWSAALTRAVLTCNSWATAAVIAVMALPLLGGPGAGGLGAARLLAGGRGLCGGAGLSACRRRRRGAAARGESRGDRCGGGNHPGPVAHADPPRVRGLRPTEPGGTQAGRRSSLPRPKKAAPPPAPVICLRSPATRPPGRTLQCGHCRSPARWPGSACEAARIQQAVRRRGKGRTELA